VQDILKHWWSLFRGASESGEAGASSRPFALDGGPVLPD
jgi:hypothetical protein